MTKIKFLKKRHKLSEISNMIIRGLAHRYLMKIRKCRVGTLLAREFLSFLGTINLLKFWTKDLMKLNKFTRHWLRKKLWKKESRQNLTSGQLDQKETWMLIWSQEKLLQSMTTPQWRQIWIWLEKWAQQIKMSICYRWLEGSLLGHLTEIGANLMIWKYK